MTRSNLLSSLEVLAVVFVMLAVSGTTTYGADWPNWRGPEHNGISKETDWSTQWPAEGPKVLWRASVGTGFSSFAVSNGRVYTMGNTAKKGDKKQDHKDVVYCFDAVTGKTIWHQSYPSELAPKQYEGGPNATPTVDGKYIYTWGKQTDLHCFNAVTGEVVWAKNLKAEYGLKMAKHGLGCSPLIQGDLLIINGIEVTVALDKTSKGDLIWKTPTGPGSQGAGYSTPVPYTLNGENCIAVFQAEGSLGIRVSDGRVLWNFPFTTQYNLNVADPVVIGDKIFLSSGYGSGCVLITMDGEKPSQLWKNKNMRNHFNSSIFYNGCIYGFDESILTCLDSKDGSTKWTEKSLGKGSLMVAGDKLVILGDRGKLVIAETSSEAYKPLAEAQILKGKCWTTPILSNGRIYARNDRGDVICLDVSK